MTTQTAGGGDSLAYATLGLGGADLGVGPTLLDTTLRAAGISVCEGYAMGEPLPPGAPSLLSDTEAPPCSGRVVAGRQLVRIYQVGDFGSSAVDAERRAGYLLRALESTAEMMEAVLGSLPDRPTLLLVLTPTSSAPMNRVGDKVTPLVMAEGMPGSLFAASGATRVLRSDTTRQAGLVANVDVAPTILDFFDIAIPKEMTGNPIQIDGITDLEHLHQVHLDQRRIRLPVQLGEVAFVAALGIVGIAALIWLGIRGSLPPRFGAVIRYLALCAVALPIPLMAGGLLPRLTYWVVVPFLVLSVVALAVAALAARWPGAMGPFRFLGAVGLAFVVLDALFGWRGARVPLIGGTMFDGVRFYGLPNAFIGLLLASALFVAVGLEPFAGFLLLLAAGLFAGFPGLGANVGAAITLFVTAGMWWALRTRRRFGLREVAFVAGTAATGLAAVLLANRYLPGAPTHITGFVQRTEGLEGTWHAFRRRLDVGFGQIGDVPAALIPLIGLVVVLVLVLAPPRPIRAGLELAGRVWQKVLVAMTVGGIAAFFVNDTGVAAAAPVFLFAMTAMAYPAFLAARRA
jgi:hypothetical protein